MQNTDRCRPNQFQPTHIWNPWSNKTNANLECFILLNKKVLILKTGVSKMIKKRYWCTLWTASQAKACEARWKRRWMTSIGKILVYYLHTWASKTWFRSQPSKSFLRRYTVGPNNQKHAQKLDSKNLWNWPIILISANNFDKFLTWTDCNDGKRKLCELAWKKLSNHIKWTYFWRVLASWKPLLLTM